MEIQISKVELFRPTRAVINLDALKHNYGVIKKLLPKGVDVLAMVKANAYGHGAVPVSEVLIDCGAKALGVATVEEGLELRNAGISHPILVMGGLMGMGSPASTVMVNSGLTPVIHSANVVDSLEAVAASAKKKIAVHLKVDTGMSRLGVRPEALPSVLEHLSRCKWVHVEGVMTHLAKAEDNNFTSKQEEIFSGSKEVIEKKLGSIKIWHIANSAGILNSATMPFKVEKCWVRPGIALYGSTRGVLLPDDEKLQPVMRLESKIALLKHVPSGTPVSYGCTFVTKRPSRIAVVPIGYADGYLFALSNKACALINGKRAQVVGRVTMDMICLDVTDINSVSVGDDVVLMGEQKEEFIGVDELASLAGTIPYEIWCGISERIPRVYENS